MKGTCHCGRSSWALEGPVDAVTACNCTVCRRYGALWAYGYEGAATGMYGETRAYTREGKADPTLEFHHCSTCGGVVGYRALRLEPGGRRKIAVNVRMAEPQEVADLPVERFDGLDTFEDLPPDGRRVRDLWF